MKSLAPLSMSEAAERDFGLRREGGKGREGREGERKGREGGREGREGEREGREGEREGREGEREGRERDQTTLHLISRGSRKGWFSNTSFTIGLKNLANISTRCSGLLQGEGRFFNPVVKLVLENQPFLMPEPAEKPSFHREAHCHIQRDLVLTFKQKQNRKQSIAQDTSAQMGLCQLCT